MMQVDELERSARDLLDSPGGRLLDSLRGHLRTRLGVLSILFLLGFLAAFPLAGDLIAWLVEDSGYVPEGTEVVILSPIELLALKLRISAFAGLSLCVLLLLSDLILRGVTHPAVKERIEEAGVEVPRPGLAMMLGISSAVLLVIISQWWTLGIMVPVVLDHLAADAASSGLDTTWRLSAFIGFVLNLCFAGLIAFQTPLATLFAIRNGIVESRVIRAHRRHVWFAAVVAGALLSPPDPLSMILVSAPIIILFEVALLIDTILR